MAASWIERRTGEEVAAQIRTVFAPRRAPEDDWDRGWAAAVLAITNFINSDGAQL
ncbi:hypothetical protein [Mycobacterium sp. PSTR-4-N]|uniref:hypothetical protein n=1 Tax=Mycobacterium sp. PSTR-4-N TaxID=2917745 RepID=UPI001F1535DC|nr:hypothetical protein [Mycobacterium sp. PSTR-4-N]MCG7593724.1 hypothetical protein [Mycobacterium sp. PSTR-4-N]